MPAITVVIPTLGGPSLKTTIETLNRGSIVPSEILVCIPAAEAHRVESLLHENVKVIVTESRGQVAQRAIGFRCASHDFVMQLDDDILLDERCMEFLLNALVALGPGAAVGPSFMSLATGASVYRKPDVNEAMLSFYYWLMNGRAGYQQGKIDKAGTLVGVDPGTAKTELVDVDCLAGGCVMYRRTELVLDDFYPFPGKAYYEDVAHCHHLRRKGIALKVHTKAKCWLETESSFHLEHRAYLRYLATDYQRRRFAMGLDARGSPRIGLFYVISYLRYCWKKLRGRGAAPEKRQSQ